MLTFYSVATIFSHSFFKVINSSRSSWILHFIFPQHHHHQILGIRQIQLILSLELSYPKEMGGTGAATNPEQLFAAGYAACFSNAILHVARESKVVLQAAPVTSEVGIITFQCILLLKSDDLSTFRMKHHATLQP